MSAFGKKGRKGGPRWKVRGPIPPLEFSIVLGQFEEERRLHSFDGALPGDTRSSPGKRTPGERPGKGESKKESRPGEPGARNAR